MDFFEYVFGKVVEMENDAEKFHKSVQLESEQVRSYAEEKRKTFEKRREDQAKHFQSIRKV